MSDHPEPPDMDLIWRVQNARMQHDRDTTPSEVAAIYWIESKPKTPGPAPTSRAGAFILLTDLGAVDGLWATVKQATEAGTLGYKAKVLTASRTGLRDDREIHVLTYDADDLADVARVGNALKTLGLTPREYRRTAE